MHPDLPIDKVLYKHSFIVAKLQLQYYPSRMAQLIRNDLQTGRICLKEN